MDSKWALFIIRGCYIILENEGTGIIAGPFTLGYQEIDCFLVLHISDLGAIRNTSYNKELETSSFQVRYNYFRI